MVQTLEQLTPVRWSVDDYHQMVRAGILRDRRVELLEGNIVEMSPVEPIHDDLGDELAAYLRAKLGARAKIRECKAVTLPTSEPQPDIAVVENRRYGDHHPYPENIYLLIEIAKSRPARDLEVKRQIYARSGIVEYWVFNLEKQELKVFRDLQGDQGVADYRVDAAWTMDTLCIEAIDEIVLSAVELRRLAFE